MGNKVEKKNGVPSVEHSCTEENKHSVLPHVHVGPTLKYHRLCSCKVGLRSSFRSNVGTD